MKLDLLLLNYSLKNKFKIIRAGIIILFSILSIPIFLSGCVPYIIGEYHTKPKYINSSMPPQYYTPKSLPHNIEEGIASWYGPGFQGRPTASGHIYNMYDLTAASRTLPLDTYAYVTDLKNGRSVEVYVDDRGPYYGGRIMDLSYAAARALNMLGPGTALVKIQYLGPNPAAKVEQNEINGFGTKYLPPLTGYTLQFAAYTSKNKAFKKKKVIANLVPGVHIITKTVHNTDYYCVVLGKFDSLNKAYVFAKVIAKEGYDIYITKRG